MQDEYDVVVVGGGAGGIGAAMGAAKEGTSVLLVERYGFLGGEATGGLVNTFMPYKLGGENLTNPAFDEIEARLEAAGALTTDETLTPDRKTFDEEALKRVLDQVMRDYHVDVLLHSFFAGLELSGSRIQRIHTYGKSGRIAVSGRVCVDGTGDGDLAARAEAPFEMGRPGDGLCQPMTTYFQVGGISPDAWIPDLRQELIDILAEAKSTGELVEPYDKVHIYRCVDPHVYAMQCTHVVKLNGVDTEDLTRAEQWGRQQVYAIYCIFRRLSPHSREAHLLKTGVRVGVHETRRVLGAYVKSEPKSGDLIPQIARFVLLKDQRQLLGLVNLDAATADRGAVIAAVVDIHLVVIDHAVPGILVPDPDAERIRAAVGRGD
jgi:hypothetical protein